MSLEAEVTMRAKMMRATPSPKLATGTSRPMDAFDSDVLIYALEPEHPLGRRVRALFTDEVSDDDSFSGIGSVVLLREVLSKPTREGDTDKLNLIFELLGRLELLPTHRAVADLAASFGARYRLQAADAIHLATAVNVGADRFITNNRRDFPKAIEEILITYPEDLHDQADASPSSGGGLHVPA
jgi:predicted nucleic acid-binding protein